MAEAAEELGARVDEVSAEAHRRARSFSEAAGRARSVSHDGNVKSQTPLPLPMLAASYRVGREISSRSDAFRGACEQPRQNEQLLQPSKKRSSLRS
jgi:hypothetical protein